MSDPMADIQPLAKAIDLAEPAKRSAEQGPELLCYAQARAALHFLGSVDEKGEVVALGRDAIRKAVEALEIAESSAFGTTGNYIRDALRALRGEGGEE